MYTYGNLQSPKVPCPGPEASITLSHTVNNTNIK